MISDRRTLYTKKVIKESLLKLLENNILEKITIKEICFEAEINRGTFYRHYQNIYDLFEEIESEFIDKIYTDSEKDFSINALLKLIYNHQGFYREFFLNHLESKRIKKQVNHIMSTHNLSSTTKDSEIKAAINKFTYYGTTGLIREWVNNGCKIAPDHFETILIDTISIMSNK